VGFEGDMLAFVELHTRALVKGRLALPELSISPRKTRSAGGHCPGISARAAYGPPA